MPVSPPNPPYVGPAAHTSAGDNKPISRIVIHGTVSPCEPGGARNIAAYFRSKSAGGSAHYVVDPAEEVQVVYDGVVAWHAPPNSGSIGVELCDRQKGRGSRWSNPDHAAMLARAAVLVARLCLAYDVPIVRLSVADLKAGKNGICGHVDVSHAFRQTTHTDPGDGFPWDAFVAQVHAEARKILGPVAPRPPVRVRPRCIRAHRRDTLWRIALRRSAKGYKTGTTLHQLRALNPDVSGPLRLGRKVRVR